MLTGAPAHDPDPLFAAGGEMGRLMSSWDWAATAVGPVEGWPTSLRTAVGVMLRSRFPMFMGWGEALTMFYNDAYIPVLGGKHPQALGSPTARVWAEIWDVLGPLAGDVMAGRASYAEDLLLVMRRAGFTEETYFTFSYSPIPGDDATPGGLFCACTETTERVIGERRLRVLSALGDITAATAPTAEQVCVAAVEVLRGARADVPFALAHLRDGERVRLVAHHGLASDAAAVRSDGGDPGAVRRVAAGGAAELRTGLAADHPGAFEPAVIGAAVPTDALVLPLTAAGRGGPVGALVLGITPYRRLDAGYRSFLDLVAGAVSTALTDALAYQDQRRRAEELAELDRAKTEFFSNVSHEFRTPLTLIRGPVRDLLVGAVDDPARVRTELATVERNAARLARLVNTLLDFSRLQAGRAQARYEPTDLAALTADLASQFRSAVERAGLGLVVDCPPLGEPVHVDRDMWEKVVLNLLSNAVKFTLAGGIGVALRRAGNDAVLTVTDSGVGIPDDERPRLFERFHRAAAGRGRSAEGSGIGLALVRELVELHGGGIEVTSQVDVGTTFTVRLPLGTAHLPVDRLHGPARAAPDVAAVADPYVTEAARWLLPVTEAAAGPAGPAAAEVLVVDDNPDMREYLTRLLSPTYRVRVAGDGRAGLRAIRDDPPDLVITDVMMPRLDGFGLLSALRADRATAGTPVIVLSARAGPESAIEGLAAGGDEYLVKPFTAAELLARVRSQLTLARSRDAEAHAGRERFRALVEQVDVGIFRTSGDGALVYVNDQYLHLMGCTAEELAGPGWLDRVHPDDLDRVARPAAAAAAAGRGWTDEFRVRTLAGEDARWLRVSAQPMRGPDGGFAGYLGTAVDISALRAAEEDRRRAAAAEAARVATEAAAARLQTLVSGLDAVVWEADAATREVEFVTERIVELLGHPLRTWLGSSDLWDSLVHPDDRDRVTALVDAALAEGRGWQQTYRMIAADGRTVWVQTLVHVVGDDRGRPARLQGIMIDVTPQKRREQASELLLRVGGLETDDRPLTQRLAELVEAATPLLGEVSALARLGPDGLLHTVAVSAPGLPGAAAALLGLPPVPVPSSLVEAMAAGRAFVLPGTGEAQLREIVPDGRELREWLAVGARDRLVVPLTGGGAVLGVLTVPSVGRVRPPDAFDLALAEELGRRTAAMMQADEAARRERQLRGLTTDLAAAATVADVADVLMTALADAFGATSRVVYTVAAEGLVLARAVGYPAEVVERFTTIPLDAATPPSDAARTGEPVWLRDHGDWAARYPHLRAEHEASGDHALEVLPLWAGGRVVAVVAGTFPTPRTFPRAEQEFALTLAATAAQAADRAAEADHRRSIAETLQRRLLPHTPPTLDHLALATHYLPGEAGVAAGGDWYDVVRLDADRTAIVVGDVVGQGATAAAVMGQLRSALATILRTGAATAPAAALAHLNRIAAETRDARASTAVCLVVDTAAGQVRWARAGHPPPLLVPLDGPVRFLEDGAGPLLGAVGLRDPIPGPYPEAVLDIAPGDTVVLYTDGLVERRGEVIDDGMERLRVVASPGVAPADLTADLIGAALPDGRTHDDIAVVAARLLPPALRQRRPARPEELADLRRDVGRWAAENGLDGRFTDDLQLVLGEAVANSAEHAYPDGVDGEFDYALRRVGDAAVEASVADRGTWRPPPFDRGYRGRGLDLIERMTTGFAIDHGPGGTTVRFTLHAEDAPVRRAPR